MWRRVYFPTRGGCTQFTEFRRAWMLAFKGKHVSWEMDVEGQREQLRLFLILLHSHIMGYHSNLQGKDDNARRI